MKSGSRVEFGVADGKRELQALSVRVLEAPVSLAKSKRKPADDMAVIIEDLVKLLDDALGGGACAAGATSSSHGRKIASVLRKVAQVASTPEPLLKRMID